MDGDRYGAAHAGARGARPVFTHIHRPSSPNVVIFLAQHHTVSRATWAKTNAAALTVVLPVYLKYNLELNGHLASHVAVAASCAASLVLTVSPLP